MFEAFQALPRRKRRALTFRARNLLPSGLEDGSAEYHEALRRQVACLLVEEHGANGAVTRLLEVVDQAEAG